MQIHELPTISGSPSGGYFATDNGTQTTKIDYTALAQAIIEQYNASTLAGAAQSVKSAIDAINSNAYFLDTAKTRIPANADLNTYKTPGRYFCINATTASSLSNCPVAAGFTLRIETIGADWMRQIIDVAANADIIQWQRILTPSSNTWSEWAKEPTRVEVDAINSKFDGNNIQFVNIPGSSGNANNAIRFRGESESEPTEHEYVMFGIGSGNRMFGFYAYIRYSSQTITVYSFGDIQCTGSISGDTAIIKVATWMKSFGIVRNKVASVDYTNVS